MGAPWTMPKMDSIPLINGLAVIKNQDILVATVTALGAKYVLKKTWKFALLSSAVAIVAIVVARNTIKD